MLRQNTVLRFEVHPRVGKAEVKQTKIKSHREKG